MIKNKRFTTILLALIFLSSTHLNGQISKGDFMFDYNGSISYSIEDNTTSPYRLTNNPSFGLGFSYMKMITNRLMLGGGFNFSQGVLTSFNNLGVLEYYSFNTYQVSPQLRFYFYNKKIALFANVYNEFNVRKYKSDIFGEPARGGNTYVGFGANYFLNKNIAIESTLRSNVLNYDENEDASYELIWNTSLKLILHPGFSGKVDSLASKVLKKGNIFTSLRFRFLPRFSDDERSNLNISPSFGYFIDDKLRLNVGSSFVQINSAVTNRQYLNLSFGGTYYQNITGNFFSSIGLGIFLRSRDIDGSGATFFRSYSVYSNLVFHYFKKQKRFDFGIRYSFHEFGLGNTTGTSISGLWELFGGLDYYVSDNFYLRSSLNWSMNDSNSLGRDIRGRLSFGVGYLFNTENFKF